MKRLREEPPVNPQLKRPFASSSRGEPYGMSHVPVGSGGSDASAGHTNGAAVASSSRKQLTRNDALAYLKEVKDIFHDRKDKYDKFIHVMNDFKEQSINTAGVTKRVKELFKGYPNLILGFNKFLPEGSEITLNEEKTTPPKATEEAIDFINTIKKRFENEEHVYKSFVHTLMMFKKKRKRQAEVYQEISVLFCDHPDLLDGFTKFLPDPSPNVSAPSTSVNRHSPHGHDDRSYAVPSPQQFHVDEQQPYAESKVNLHGEREHIDEKLYMNDDKSVMKLNREQKKHIEKETREYINHDQDVRSPDAEGNGHISMHQRSERKVSAPKLEDVAGNSKMGSHDDKDVAKGVYSREFTFCEKVKERLHGTDDYQAFLKCLNIYSTEIITRNELQSLVADLLGKYPDLMEGFQEFLEHCERNDGFLAGVMGKQTLWNEGTHPKALGIEEKGREERVQVDEVKEKDKCSLKYWGKSNNEIDFTNCKSCTPSYRLLPDDYPIPVASHRSKLETQVLNDHWVSVTSGSEDYTFKHMRRNHYEESLFRCEDDRYELDMLLESVRSTVKQALELLTSVNQNAICLDNPLRIEDHFTALNIRCIERLYGDHCLHMMDFLRKSPSLALPVVIRRLQQKQEEWAKCRSDFNKVWAEIYAKNHNKALDHRSFYFKIQDSKNLGTKSLVAEIKEIKEKRLKDNDLPNIAAGNRHPIIPDLAFEFVDAETHEDVYKIIKYSCEEVFSTKEQLNKVLKFWTTFFEPMLGVRTRLYGSEAVKDGSATTRRKVKKTTTTVMKREGSSKPDVSRDVPKIVSTERLTISDRAATLTPEANHGNFPSSLRGSSGIVEISNRPKPRENLVSLECGETSRSNQLTNGESIEDSIFDGHNRASVDPSKNEKEEGELSPYGDFEDNFGAYEDGCSPEKNSGNDGMQCHTRSHAKIRAGDIDGDADDEDSENVSEAGEDASASDFAANDSSGEDEDEEEDEEHDDKADIEVDTEYTSETHFTRGAMPSKSERASVACKPLSKHVPSASVGYGKKDQRVFYANDSFYVLFRLHQRLYKRILSAKMSILSGKSKRKTTKDENHDLYSRFMNILFCLLDGSCDNTQYEDDCRSLIGNESYKLFTMDKLIYKLVRQLQTVSNEEVDRKLVQLYEYEQTRSPTKFVDSVYFENVHILLHEENIYRLEYMSSTTRLSVYMINDGSEKSEDCAISVDPNFANYLQNDYLSEAHGKKDSSAMALKRNLHKYANLDESTAPTDKCLIRNGLECKMAAASSKFQISYVVHTEDCFIRLRRRLGNGVIESSSRSRDKTRVKRFHQLLEASL